MSERNKFLFVYLKTGGGHLAPARSVAKFIEKYFADKAEVVLADGFAESRKIAKIVVEDGYRILQNKSKWIYEVIYAIHKFKPVSHISAFMVSVFIDKYLTKIILNDKPDKIVIFHFFLIKSVYRILRKHNLNIPVYTVVTDPFIAHPLWFLRKEQKFIVFSDQLKRHCLSQGIKEENISVFPFILDEKFSVRPGASEIDEFRKKVGFSGNKILLVLGGGDGIPNGEAILENLLKTPDDFEIAIVCGKNKELFEYATKLKSREESSRLKVFGYIDFVYELLSVSDVIITKCGASTFMEILLSNKIPLVNSYIWEQEKGNVDFLVNNNLGFYEKRIRKLPEIVQRLFKDQHEMGALKTRISEFGFKNGTPEVTEYLLK